MSRHASLRQNTETWLGPHTPQSGVPAGRQPDTNPGGERNGPSDGWEKERSPNGLPLRRGWVDYDKRLQRKMELLEWFKITICGELMGSVLRIFPSPSPPPKQFYLEEMLDSSNSESSEKRSPGASQSILTNGQWNNSTQSERRGDRGTSWSLSNFNFYVS